MLKCLTNESMRKYSIETLKLRKMKRILSTGILIMLTIIMLQAAEKDRATPESDTTSYIEVTGKVIDGQTQAPVVFATISVRGTSVATVSNNDGDFILKIPKEQKEGKISFAHLGYENSVMDISFLTDKNSIIKLSSVNMPIDEVVVRTIDPVSLIYAALEKVKDNYSVTPEMQTSFYREAIKQNRKYVSVSEAVLDIYKAPYKTSFDFDRMKIYKGRKSQDVKKMDTLLVKLQGGPKTSLMLDVVKNPGDLLDREILDYYIFELSGITTIDNRETYVIKFDQKDNIEYPLFKGSIYIDTETHAFAGIDFSLSEKGLPHASEFLVKKKPTNLDIMVERGHYLVRYRKDKDNWYLNYVRSELDFDTKWKRKLFKSKISVMLEMAVTDRNKDNIIKFSNKESAKLNDIFADQVLDFKDNGFWGDYNTIKPDESIEIAIEKLNKKLKRRQ